MVRLTTHYDKSIKKKVYQVRGDESYAHTTDVSLANSTILDGRMKGFKTDLTATIYRGMGASTVLFYDGEEVIGQEHISNGTSTVTLSDVYLSWIYPHELYVRYLGNDSCLSSRSKKLSLQRELPDDLKIIITDDTATHQYNTGATIPITATLTVDGEAITTNVDVKVYVDDTLKDTITSSDEVVSGELTDISDGKHTIRLVVEDSSSVHGSTLSYDIKVGYKVDILSYSSPYIVGGTNSATVEVLDYDDTPVNNGTVTIGSDSGTTNSDGIATISLTSYSQSMTASCNGSTSSSKTNTSFTPSSITIVNSSASNNEMVYGEQTTVHAYIRGDGNYVNVPVTLTIGDSTSNGVTNASGRFRTYHTGTGAGDISCSASIDGTSISTTKTISDYYSYVKGGNVFNFNPSYDSTSTFTSLQNYCRMRTTSLGSSGLLIVGNYSLRGMEWDNPSSYQLLIRITNYNLLSIFINVGRIVEIPSTELSANCTIDVEITTSSVIAKVNGRTVATNSNSGTIKQPIIQFTQNPSTSSYAQLDFDELKIKKLS